MPHSVNVRPIPFALRDQVRAQIQAMLKDGMLEVSHSAYINPINLVAREGNQFVFAYMLDELTNRWLQNARKLCQCVNFGKDLMVPNILRVWTRQCFSTCTS
jgi:hypothetical protein